MVSMQERIYKTQAVVLRRFDFGESGKQLLVYTPRFGKRSMIAKGIKRPTSKMAGHLEPLTLTQIVAAQGRNLDVVTQADTIEPFTAVRMDSARVFHGLMVAEMLDKLTGPDESNPRTWDLLLGTLRRLEVDSDPWMPALYFQVQMLELAGYRPELQLCVECGGKLEAAEVSYNPEAGGTVCRQCRGAGEGAFPISANAVKLLRAASHEDYARFRRIGVSSELRREVDTTLATNLARLLDVEIGSSAVLRSFAGL